jgi:hypothetical protein
VKGNRVALAYSSEIAVWRTTVAHIILGVDFKKANVWLGFYYGLVMLRFEADPSTGWKTTTVLTDIHIWHL